MLRSRLKLAFAFTAAAAAPNLLYQLTQHPPQDLTIYKRTPIEIKTIHLVQEIDKVQAGRSAAQIFGVAADKTFASVSNPDTCISLHSNSKSFSFLKLFDLRPLSFAKHLFMFGI